MQRYDHGGDIYTNPDIKLDFSVNTNPLGMPERVKHALTMEMDSFSRYPDPKCMVLRLALAKHHGMETENILCGNGAADLIFRVCAWRKPKRVLLPAPTFSEYERPIKLFGGRVEEYLLREKNRFELTEKFADAIKTNTDMVVLCNPNNPTGRLIPRRVLTAILDRCSKTGSLLMVDECFIEFTGASSLLTRLNEYPNLLILRAFTKLYAMAGLRLGYLLGSAEKLKQIEAYGAHWSVSGPAQTAGTAALRSEPLWTMATRSHIANERTFMTERLREIGITVYPSDTCFLLLRSSVPLHEELKKRGLLIRDCSNFTGLDKSYARIGLKMRSQNEVLLAAIREVMGGTIPE